MVTLSSEVSVNSTSMLLVIVPAASCSAMQRCPCITYCYRLPTLTRMYMPSLLRSLLPRVFTGYTEITILPCSEFITSLSWYTFIHWWVFFFLKIYHTATGKGVWPLQAFFSQAALCPLLAFPIRRGLSQKGTWLEGVPSWTPVFSQVLVEKPAPASVQWLLAGIQNWNVPCFCKWQKVGGQLEKYLFLACPHT